VAQIEIHVKIDTGMNCLGVPESEWGLFLDRLSGLPALRAIGLGTHLSSADADDPGTTSDQLRRFEAALSLARSRGLAPAVAHAANSAAALRFPAARFQAVRPGLALYGAMPSPLVARSDFEPVLTLRTKIMAVHDLRPGATVSYGALWRAARPSRIATLPIGYADGYPQGARGAQALLGGRRVPVVGVVCMDMLMVDVTDVPGVGVDETVTLIGRSGGEVVSAGDLACWAGTSAYEILCGISKRVPRLYKA
jgi:alanine racemase